FVERLAAERGLTGWVRNNDDGSVEAVLQGLPDDLKACIEEMHRGSPLARVESVAVDWRTPEKQFDEFKVISS
ncbi:MAG TPA: acylphosphatase, partial [Candidatus Paceibacterota bacterium]|nr:acylphosphatase [Candidatus Paceibacterota bacterium]